MNVLKIPLRYLLAFYLIPVGLLLGVCGLLHAALRRLVPHRCARP